MTNTEAQDSDHESSLSGLFERYGELRGHLMMDPDPLSQIMAIEQFLHTEYVIASKATAGQ